MFAVPYFHLKFSAPTKCHFSFWCVMAGYCSPDWICVTKWKNQFFYIIELERNRLALFTVSIQLLIIHAHTTHNPIPCG